MLFRILYLIALIGIVGRDSGPAPEAEVVATGEEQRMGGEGFGNVVSLVALIGVAALAAVVILAILSLSGQFSNDIIDPPT